MLEALIVILVVLWALGFLAFHAGAVIHFLLVVALVVFIYRLVRDRRRPL